MSWFQSFISQNNNNSISRILKAKDNQIIMEERSKFFLSLESPNNKNILDSKISIEVIAIRMLDIAGIYVESCEDCQISSPNFLNINLTKKSQIKDLQSFIITSGQSRNTCTCSTTNILNKKVKFIHFNSNDENFQKMKIEDIPEQIMVQGLEYCLISVVLKFKNNFFTICKNDISQKWNQFNDFQEKVTKFEGSKKISNIQSVVYVLKT